MTATDQLTRPDWRIECRACGAWFVTYLRADIEEWLRHHAHAPARYPSNEEEPT